MEEMWKIYRLMCFNVLIGNRDDHARNFAFLYDKGWRFAPAYDILPCGVEGDYHTTSVNDNPLPHSSDVIALATAVGLPEKEAVSIYESIANLVRH